MIGQSIGHFQIQAKIGEGGMGEVYRALDTRLQREVAIKVLPESLAADAQRMGRFEREAQLLASLNHPNIASIYGVEESDGRKALIMEVVEGEDLSQRIGRGPLGVEQAAGIALEIAKGLESAHERGIVHRDLKPGNVKISGAPASRGTTAAATSTAGQVKLLDFGLAKALEGETRPGDDDRTQSPTLSLAATQAGLILGTAAYMSPEQAAGQSVDRRADIWSFGVVLYEMLTGRQPFHGETVSHTLADVLRADIDWEALPDDLPQPIEHLLRRCLDRDPNHRLRDIGEARVVLEDFLADPDAARAAVGATPEAATRRRVLVPWLVTGGATALLGTALWLSWMRAEPSSEPVRFVSHLTDAGLFIAQDASVVLSPDGRRIAWVSNDGVRASIFVRSLDQLEGRELIGSETDLPHSPFFSPDGQWIGFYMGGSLRKAPFAGGTPQTICEARGLRGAAWGPDGTIVFSPAAEGNLFRVPAAGGEATPLTELAEGEGFHRYPSFLPGGEAIVFFTDRVQSASFENALIEVLDLASGQRKAVHRGGYYPRILPTGHLLYSASGTIFAAPFDLSSHGLRGDPVPVVENVASNPARGSAQYSVSESGTLVYVSGVASFPEYPIVRARREGGTETLWREEATYGKPRFSPDGKRLAVTAMRHDNWDIWVFDLERGVPTRLTFDEGIDSEHVWSPDGRYIVWSSDRSGVDNLYRKRADGSGEVERLTESERAQWATDWSPEGRYLLFMQQEGPSRDLFVLDLESEAEPEAYLATQFDDDFGVFSPDGRWVAYSSQESGRPEVYVRPFPLRGGKWQISDSGGSQPRWGPEGRELYYRSATGIMVAAVDGTGDSLEAGRPRRIVEGAFRGGLGGVFIGTLIFSDYDVAPDGDSFVLFSAEGTAEEQLQNATFVLDWFDELQRIVPPA